MSEAEKITAELNELIDRCVKLRGHVYIVDKAHNSFSLRLTEPIVIRAFSPKEREGETKDV